MLKWGGVGFGGFYCYSTCVHSGNKMWKLKKKCLDKSAPMYLLLLLSALQFQTLINSGIPIFWALDYSNLLIIWHNYKMLVTGHRKQELNPYHYWKLPIHRLIQANLSVIQANLSIIQANQIRVTCDLWPGTCVFCPIFSPLAKMLWEIYPWLFEPQIFFELISVP